MASSSLNAANCTAAPDCDVLNRYDCGANDVREDNTCGECLEGTIGVMGPDNSQCLDPNTLDESCEDETKVGGKFEDYVGAFDDYGGAVRGREIAKSEKGEKTSVTTRNESRSRQCSLSHMIQAPLQWTFELQCAANKNNLRLLCT